MLCLLYTISNDKKSSAVSDERDRYTGKKHLKYIAFSCLMIIIMILIIIVTKHFMKPAVIEKQRKQVQTDFLMLGKAMNLLFVDGGEPESAPVGERWSTFENIVRSSYPHGYSPPLTTPVAYITGLPRDPFNPDKNFYGYISFTGKYKTAVNPPVVLHSFGPDRDLDIDHEAELEWNIVVPGVEYDRHASGSVRTEAE